MFGLEVQDGGEGLHHFSSQDIWWTEICVDDDSTKDFCVTIPFARLDAFIKGESLVEGFETKFVRKRHTEDDNSSVHDNHTIKMYSRYWCSYGPKDSRNKLPPSKQNRVY
ncbi:hypothetical protein SUGI_0063110 [Cryptomeria japonica]|nr:hypothetical protein SUGI_0063110 [Cryptomeria japonica]